jgi:phosphatidate cytidylyltransferase
LKTRILSAIILAPGVVAAIYFGTPWFDLLVAAMVLLMAIEWRGLCVHGRFDATGYLFAGTAAAAVGAIALGHSMPALIILLVGALVVAIYIMIRRSGGVMENPGWTVAGVLLVGGVGISLIWMRAVPEAGLSIVIWFIVTIWCTDTGAYFSGRAIGGPKLAPRISPNKTWAGLFGGMAAAALWGACWGFFLGNGQMITLSLLAAGTAILGQIGDLGVSVVKRHFGVKDSGRLIPGHGGILDRVDGFVVAAPIIALSIIVTGGDSTPWT